MNETSWLQLITLIINKISNDNLTILIYLTVGSFVFHKFYNKNMIILIKIYSRVNVKLKEIQKEIEELKKGEK